MTRGLYAADYLQSGCTIDFDDSYAVDNTLWTYVSAYGVATVAFLSGAMTYSLDGRKAMSMSMYCLVTSVGYALAGVSHQTANTTNDWQYRILGPIALAFTVFGTSFLMRVGLLHCFFSDSLFANALWFATNVTIILYSILLEIFIVASIWMVVIYVGMSILFLGQATWRTEKTGRIWLILKILAMHVTVGGFVIQDIFEGSCGVEGLESCFNGCPLPDPTALNNTAIKNICVAAGVCFLAIAEIFLPAHNFWDDSKRENDESVFTERKNDGSFFTESKRDESVFSSISGVHSKDFDPELASDGVVSRLPSDDGDDKTSRGSMDSSRGNEEYPGLELQHELALGDCFKFKNTCRFFGYN